MHYFGASKVIIVNKTGLPGSRSRYRLVRIIARGDALGLSGVVVFTGYETSAHFGSYACLPARLEAPRMHNNFRSDVGIIGPLILWVWTRSIEDHTRTRKKIKSEWYIVIFGVQVIDNKRELKKR